MRQISKSNLLGIFTAIFVTSLVLLVAPCSGESRRIKPADEMPQFTLQGPNGVEFTYKHDRKRVLAIAFLSGNQKQSKDAAADIAEIVKNLSNTPVPYDFVAVIEDSNSRTYFQSIPRELQSRLHIVLDAEYKLWGQLGLIATPTAMIVGTDDKVQWVKAGYGYDFAPALKSHLEIAVGIAKQLPEESTSVKTLTNASVESRLTRHLQVAKMLEQKGSIESAIQEVRNAQNLDPNSVEVAIILGELYCKTGQSDAALKAVDKIKTQSQAEKAQTDLILGWANRQKGEIGTAEKYMVEATTLDPKSGRAFFELGKVYEAKGQFEKSAQAYHKALSLIFTEPAETPASHQ